MQYNPVTHSPLQVPFARLLTFKEYSVTNFEIGWGAVCCLFGMFELASSKIFFAMPGKGCVIQGLHIQNQDH